MTSTPTPPPPIRAGLPPGTPHRVVRDLNYVTDVVRDNDPALRALILTGGFARGEGTMQGGQPQNDYDLVAVRGVGRARQSYPTMRQHLEASLGLHIDLCPTPSWRIPRHPRSIFWYETALRGRILWGADILSRIHPPTPQNIDPTEGLRLLVNRAAGLLLVTRQNEPHAHRIQAVKALLAAADAHLLASGQFAPSQRERWGQLKLLHPDHPTSQAVARLHPWLAWAYRSKINPDHTPRRDHRLAWRAAANAILDAVPTALGHARLESLDQYARSDRVIDHLVYQWRANKVPGARRLITHPTGRLRVATLRLLETSRHGEVPEAAATKHMASIARSNQHPVDVLDALRQATLQ